MLSQQGPRCVVGTAELFPCLPAHALRTANGKTAGRAPPDTHRLEEVCEPDTAPRMSQHSGAGDQSDMPPTPEKAHVPRCSVSASGHHYWLLAAGCSPPSRPRRKPTLLSKNPRSSPWEAPQSEGSVKVSLVNTRVELLNCDYLV